LAFPNAGAYDAAMSRIRNARPLAPQPRVDSARFAVARDRQPHEALVAGWRPPEWTG
jgi:diaminopimelate decarboxylase